MQQFKKLFKDGSVIGTKGNVQSCLRLNDLQEIGDGSHYLYFNMIGLFSFRELTVEQTIKFWMEFLHTLNIKPDHVTIHPDKIEEWKGWYNNVKIISDDECTWSDGGELSGYCTEFYKDGLEIGNIVNIMGDCIDVGFGYERLNSIVNKEKILSDIEILKMTIEKCIECEIKPSNKEQGYVLRKLLREFRKKGGDIKHQFFIDEKNRFEKSKLMYEKLKDKFKDKDKSWWFDTHGIDIDDIL
jgi:alanyl-tRNA synthetase